MTGMQEQENYYEIIYNLKELLLKAKKTNDFDEIDLIISKTKSYMQSYSFLQNQFDIEFKNYSQYRKTDKFAKDREFILEWQKTIIKEAISNLDLAIKKEIFIPEALKEINAQAFYLLLSFNTELKNKVLNHNYIGVQELYTSWAIRTDFYKKRLLLPVKENAKPYETLCEIDGLNFWIIQHTNMHIHKALNEIRVYQPNYSLFEINSLILKSALIYILSYFIDYINYGCILASSKNKDNSQGASNYKNIKTLNDIEVSILSLRKNLENNTYKNISLHLDIKLSESNIKAKVRDIGNKLGTRTVDEAVRVAEEMGYKL